MKQPNLGTVIEGTLRTEDLMLSLVAELAYMDSESNLVARIETKINEMSDDELSDYWTSEDASFDLDDLFTELNKLCEIPYVYFGANEGNGSDFGWWIDFEAIDEDEQNGNLVKLNSFEDVDKNRCNILVNENNTLTLHGYSATHNCYYELWSV
jgi:hypothetical protein